MHVHINHMYCTDPCWGGSDGMYWCRYSVSINRIPKGKTYYDTPEEDWTNLTEEFSFFDEQEYLRRKELHDSRAVKPDYETDEFLRSCATKTQCHKLKPEVIQWLNENIKDRQDKDYPQGWCCGSEAYLSNDPLSVNIFFHRKSDALAFIKRWSKYGKPTTYFDYFAHPIVRKELNTLTGKLVKVEEFSR